MKSVSFFTLRHATAIVLLLALAVASSAGAAPREARNATVVMAGGWELAGVTVQWSDAEGGLKVIRPDGAARLYAAGDIDAVLDARGRDITAQVMPLVGQEPSAPALQAAPSPAAPTIILRDAAPAAAPVMAVAAPAPAVGHAPRRMLNLGLDWARPNSDDFFGSDGGKGINVQARLQVGGALYLTGGYVWQYLAAPSSTPIEPGWGLNPPPTGIDDEGRLRGFWAGLSLVANGNRPGATRLYLEGGVGRFRADLMATASGDEGYLGYKAGVGVIKPFADELAVEFALRGTHIVNLDLGYGDDRQTLLGAHLGLVWMQ